MVHCQKIHCTHCNGTDLQKNGKSLEGIQRWFDFLYTFGLYFLFGTLFTRRRSRRIAANVVAAWRSGGFH
jgi:hypothetical protein